ncbi:helix-turn-helix domain-containing protein [Pontibacter pamirensis]|uniref:helix-turn-helix domain-containing protein n=1 Tax=Pontibacter pamirensis TaxID=2562824 RepID=UPI00138A44AF
MYDYTTFGSRLKSLRKHMKLSGKDLDTIFGMLRTQMSGIERDKTKPTVKRLLKLSAVFPNWIFTGF